MGILKIFLFVKRVLFVCLLLNCLSLFNFPNKFNKSPKNLMEEDNVYAAELHFMLTL